MNLFHYAILPKIRRIEPGDREKFAKLSWDPNELMDLKLMDREQLMGLMMFCNIQSYNEMPIIACEEDEMRMAYLVWRGAQSMEQRQKIIGHLEKIKTTAVEFYQGISWWIDQHY